MEIEEALKLINTLNESVKKLEAKNADIISEKRDESRKREEAENERAKADELIAKEKGDFERLLEIEKAKNIEIIEKLEATNGKRYGQLKDELLTSKVKAVNVAISGTGNKGLGLYLESRMSLVDNEGSLEVRVLDDNGKETAMTIDELQKEVTEMEDFATIAKGRKSSGSGSGGDEAGSGGAGDTDYEKYFQKGTRNIGKMIELKNADPDAYTKLNAKYPAQAFA